MAPSELPTPDSAQAPPVARRTRLKQLGAFSAAVLITVALLFLQDEIRQLGAYGYTGVFLVSLLGNATVIFPAPSFAIVFSVGGALHPVLIGVAAGVGAALGELTGYLAGVGGRAIFEDRDLYDRLTAFMQRYGAVAVFFLSAIPNPFFDVAGMVAGTLRMRIGRFLLAAALGKSLRFFLLALSGRYVLGAVPRLLTALM